MDEGALPSNHLDRWNGRANLKLILSPNLDAVANVGYVTGRSYVDREGGGSAQSVLGGAIQSLPLLRNGPTRGFVGAPPEAILAAFTDYQDLDRFIGGINLNHRPFSWFSHRITAGTDVVHEENVGLVPRLAPELQAFFGRTGLGLKQVDVRNVTTVTADYAGTVTWNVSPRLTSNTSFGAQYYRNFIQFLTTRGDEFPAPGVTTVSSAAVITGAENSVENVTVGSYVQQQFGWNNRLFLTAAVRADDNSAFGQDFDFVVYPKFSASWVVSEEPFWPRSLIGAMKLRAAYGRSGQQPLAFSSLRTFTPTTGPGNRATVWPAFVGNPDLAPERGEEIELGFEASALAERLAFDVTYYHKRTKGAILRRAVAPSSGFAGNQFVNIGEVRNRGVELMLNATPIRAQRIKWNLGATLATNDNKITDMGGLPPIATGIFQQHRLGFPVAANFGRRVVSADIDATGRAINIMCDGGPDNGGQVVPCAQAPLVFLGRITPKYEGAVTTTLTLFDRLTLFAMVDFKDNYTVFDGNINNRCYSRRLCEDNLFPERDPIAAAQHQNGIYGQSVFQDMSFAKLRTISASYDVPGQWVRPFGASAGTVTLSARNLHTWTGYWGIDPENSGLERGDESFGINQGQMPMLSQVLLSIRLTL